MSEQTSSRRESMMPVLVVARLSGSISRMRDASDAMIVGGIIVSTDSFNNGVTSKRNFLMKIANEGDRRVSNNSA
jgi:hypothetical protein